MGLKVTASLGFIFLIELIFPLVTDLWHLLLSSLNLSRHHVLILVHGVLLLLHGYAVIDLATILLLFLHIVWCSTRRHLLLILRHSDLLHWCKDSNSWVLWHLLHADIVLLLLHLICRVVHLFIHKKFKYKIIIIGHENIKKTNWY
jgi:hypothetical protein